MDDTVAQGAKAHKETYLNNFQYAAMSSLNEPVPTPSTASSSIKRERSPSPAEQDPGRDAKRVNLGEMDLKQEEATDSNGTDKKDLQVATDDGGSAPR